MIHVEYRGYEIDASATSLACGKWEAQAVVSRDHGHSLQTFPMADGRNRELDGADEAEALGLRLARTWIDHREALLSAR